MTTSVAEAPPAPTAEPSRRSSLIAAGVMAATGIFLAVAYFPMFFNSWQTSDDEGAFLVSLRDVLHGHGHLYSTIWSDKFGPFYYLVMSTLYRVARHQPTLENGRFITLVLTTASAALFAASVWRVTKNLPCTILCEVAAFVILIQSTGNEPMHPGALSVLLVAVVAYEVSSYAVNRGNAQLIGIGAAGGALLMTSLDAGVLVAIALALVFVAGSSSMPRGARMSVGSLAAVAPIVWMYGNVSTNWVAVLAFLVVSAIAGMWVLMSIDLLALPTESLLRVAVGAGAVVVCSLAFPIVTGTPVSALYRGFFVRSLHPNGITVPTNVIINWVYILITVGGVYAALAIRSIPAESARAKSKWTYAALAGFGFWLLGLGVTVGVHGNIAAPWLPGLILLPAIAFVGNSPEYARLALRSLVVLAALQILVAYPVAGSQVAWGTVAMTAPCAIAIAIGIEHFSLWRSARGVTQSLVTGVLCIGLIVACNIWPLNVWSTYLKNPKLDLPGTSLMRIDPNVALELHQLVEALPVQCGAFYTVPNENSLYLFSGFAPLTGMVANHPSEITTAEQEQVVQALRAATAAGVRVCVLKDASQTDTIIVGPLGEELQQYSKVVATVDNYSIARRN